MSRTLRSYSTSTPPRTCCRPPPGSTAGPLLTEREVVGADAWRQLDGHCVPLVVRERGERVQLLSGDGDCAVWVAVEQHPYPARLVAGGGHHQVHLGRLECTGDRASAAHRRDRL